MILPYVTPEWAEVGDSPQAVFEFSLVCLENARDILLSLESEYRALFGRNLTLDRLPEAVILPLCPDKGHGMAYNTELPASVHLENDIQMLLRMRGFWK
jgi:hypothetical protein